MPPGASIAWIRAQESLGSEMCSITSSAGDDLERPYRLFRDTPVATSSPCRAPSRPRSQRVPRRLHSNLCGVRVRERSLSPRLRQTVRALSMVVPDQIQVSLKRRNHGFLIAIVIDIAKAIVSASKIFFRVDDPEAFRGQEIQRDDGTWGSDAAAKPFRFLRTARPSGRWGRRQNHSS